MKKKLGLALQGGSTRGMYSSGVMDVLMENGIEFDVIAGTSAGSLVAYNVVSGDIGRAKNVVTSMMRSRKFFSLHNLVTKGSAFDWKILFHDIQDRYPFNQKRFDSSSTKFYAVATSLKTGKAVYFEKSDFSDFTPCLQASSSIPLICSPVMISGEGYLDGGHSDPIPYQKVLDEGCDKVIVVATRTRAYRKKPQNPAQKRLGKSFYNKKHPEYYKAFNNYPDLYNRIIEKMYQDEKDGKIFLIAPEETPDVGKIERSPKKLKALYLKGREEALRLLPEIRKYIES